MYKDHIKKYKGQRKAAKQREIPWYFTYITWWKKWCKSEHYNKRGTGLDEYCMARIGDKGPYSFNNVKIITNRENWKSHKHTKETKSKLSKAAKGRKPTKELRAKMSAAMMGNKIWVGRKHSPETRHKMSEQRKGRVIEKIQRKKMSDARKAWWERKRAGDGNT